MNSNSEINNISRAIFSTVAFFDIFDYPLTAWEIHKFLFKNNAGYLMVVRELEKLIDEKRLEIKNGFYFLPGRQEIIFERADRYSEAEIKYKIARRAVCWLTWLPTIKLVAVCNNLAYSNAQPDSDIDFFIVISKNRLWLTRFFITAIIQFLGLRRHGQKIASRICLSFYITEDNLNLEPITLKTLDPYFYYWLATLTPLAGQNNFLDFWQANSWLKNYLPNIFEKITNERRLVKDTVLSKSIMAASSFLFNGALGGRLESLARKIQLKKMSKNTQSAAGQPGSRVIISDTMLKFHENDMREVYLTKWQEKINLLFSGG